MDAELSLAAKPNRNAFKAEVEQTKKRAYERSFKQAAKEVAQAEGAAAGAAAAGSGTGGSAVERARARALSGGNPTTAPEQGTRDRSAPSVRQGAAVAAAKPSGRFVDTPEGRVPEEFYSLTPEQQQQFRALVKEGEAEAAGESRFDQTALGLVDQLLSQSKRIKSLEGQLTTVVSAFEALQRRIDGIDTAVEIGKSEALSEQQVAIAQMTTNLSAIRADAGSEMAEYNRQREVGAAAARDQLEAQTTAIEALSGSVKSTQWLVGERSNVVIKALSEAEPKIQQLQVAVVELENRTDAIGNPVTRAEMKSDITTAVTAELKAQSPEMVNQAIDTIKQDEFGGKSVFGQRMDGDYIRQKRADADAARNIR